jgi:hypothetical protein
VRIPSCQEEGSEECLTLWNVDAQSDRRKRDGGALTDRQRSAGYFEVRRTSALMERPLLAAEAVIAAYDALMNGNGNQSRLYIPPGTSSARPTALKSRNNGNLDTSCLAGLTCLTTIQSLRGNGRQICPSRIQLGILSWVFYRNRRTSSE